jgi:hypothetical protein
MLGRAPSRKVCKRFVFAMCFARVSGDDVIIVVESSSTGQRDEPCLPQACMVGSEEVVVVQTYRSLPADHGKISFREAMQCLHNALIRTHHITSRKKVAKLKQAATFHDVYVLLRYGGAPGVMYVEGKGDGVNRWVSDVQVGRIQVSQFLPAEAERYTRTCGTKTTSSSLALLLYAARALQTPDK